jgi:hypothetical protein
MEDLIALIGMMFFMFLVLAAAVEVILEVFRGLLQQFGITWAKGKVSLDEALQLASEFAPDNKDLHTKIEAVKSAAQQITQTASTKIADLTKLQNDLKAAAGQELNVIAAELNDAANLVKSSLEDAERKRIFILRLIAAVIGSFLVWQSGFYVFQILAGDPNAAKWLGDLAKQLKEPWINILVGGLAAAAGSSYWHDQLDRVRNLKSIAQGLKKVGS